MSNTYSTILDAIKGLEYGSQKDLRDAHSYIIQNQKYALPYLAEFIPNASAKQCWQVVKLASKIKNSDVIPILIECLHFSNDAVVTASAQLLGEIGGDIALNALLEALDKYESLGCNSNIIPIVQALGTVQDSRAFDKLIHTLHSTDSYVVRYTAIKSLIEIDCKGAIKDIMRYLNDDNQHVRSFAHAAIEHSQS